ncbi:DUF3135 domain-containing protein [Noviherbaspirillum sedimenti]|nr:DUF3135 domain-containing protein [Noviherbaspirillum sedimenti]
MPLPTAIPDFDMLVTLHQHDPQAFEALRCHLLQEALDAAPAARRASLELLLGRIEAARAASASPQQAASIAFAMMAESLQELRDSWQQAFHALSELQTHLLLEKVR